MIKSRLDLYKPTDDIIEEDPAYQGFPDVSLQPKLDVPFSKPSKPVDKVNKAIKDAGRMLYGQPGGLNLATGFQTLGQALLPGQKALTPADEKNLIGVQLENEMAQKFRERIAPEVQALGLPRRFEEQEIAKRVADEVNRQFSRPKAFLQDIQTPIEKSVTSLAEGRPIYDFSPTELADLVFSAIDQIDVALGTKGIVGGTAKAIRAGLSAGSRALFDLIDSAPTRAAQQEIINRDPRTALLLRQEINKIKDDIAVDGGRTTERLTDQDLATAQMQAAEERGMRFLTGKPGEKGRPMIQQSRVDQVMPRIEQLSKTKGKPLTKKEILDELKKEFPNFKDQQIEGIYLNKKAPGPGQTAKSTFPFLKFMDETKAGSGYDPSLTAKQTNIKQAEEVEQRLNNFEQSLQSNPPTKILTVKEAENLSGTKIKNINAYKTANPNSSIAKFVKDPQQKGVDQLTDDKIKLLEDEYEIFDDFVTPAQASRTTGIKPSTLNKLIKNNEKNIQDLVQPRKVSGRERNFFSSYFSPSNQKSSLDQQTKYLLVYDAYRGGKFGDKKSFTKVMEEAGVTPKKVLKDGEYVDNPNFLNTPDFIQANNVNKETFINKLIDDLDEGRIGFEKLKELVKKRNDFTQHTKQRFLDLIGRNKKFRDVFIKEYREKIGNKFGGDVERQAIDFARVFSGNMAHVTPISRIRGRTPVRGDEFKLSPGLRGQFNNPEFYRINLSVDNIALQPNFENVITKSVKQLNKQDRKGAAALRNIQRINQRMIENNQATLLEFSPKDMSDATVSFLQRRLGPQSVRFGKNKRQLFLGKAEDMSLQELKDMFDKRFAKYNLAPELFKISRQRPKGAKIADEDLVFGSAPYIRKNFILNFAEGGPVRMAIGGDPLQNINQQQFAPDPAFQGQDFFQEAVDSGNLTAFNPLRLFNTFGKVKGTPTKSDIGQPTTLPRADQAVPVVEESDFPFKSFTYEKLQSPNAPGAARPQDWANYLTGGDTAPISEIRDSGLEQFLRDYEKYYPGRKLSKQQIVDYFETSPTGNLEMRVKGNTVDDDAFQPDLPDQGPTRHKNAGSQPLDKQGTNYREVIVQAGPIPGEGQPFVNSSHFSEPNVIAFTRVADYQLADGSTAAVIQELQTDMLNTVRVEQLRIKTLLDRLKLTDQKARDILNNPASSPDQIRQAQQTIDALAQQVSPEQRALLEQTQGIKPFPNAAGASLIPGYTDEILKLQDNVNELLAQKKAANQPFIDENIFEINQRQLQLRDQLLDLNRSLEIDQNLKGIQVPNADQADELRSLSQRPIESSSYERTSDIQLFPPVPFTKTADYVDLIIKATIKDAQSRGINRVGIFTGELVNRRWGKDPTGPAGKKFNDLYSKVSVQQMNNIAKKYGGEVIEGAIVDPSKAQKGLKMTGKNVDGQFELLRDIAPTNSEGVDEFLNDQILRIVSDYGPNDVVVRREIAPGQTMEFFASRKEGDVELQLTPLGDADRAENATIIIEEYNPSLVKIPVLVLEEAEKAKGPFFLYRKKDGGKIASDGLVSITDIYGDY